MSMEHNENKRRFVERYLELKAANDEHGMGIVKNNFERVFGYSICIAEWEYVREHYVFLDSENRPPKGL